ncbi:MAG: Flp pilus assembly complex ATPase component TadA [Planctomycetes bacterium]|nr:Flp pilus assembly complex ATPase component TadA [Planctomycetota bacterium]
MKLQERLARLFQADNVLPIEKLQDCLEACLKTGDPLDSALIQRGFLTEKQMLSLLGKCLGLTYRERLQGITTPPAFVEKVPVGFARNHNLVALSAEDGRMEIATAAPLDVHPMDELSRMIDCEVVPSLATKAEIALQINKAYQQKQDVVDEMLEGMDEGGMEDVSKEVERTHDLLDLANKAPIIKMVNMILFQALKQRASDIHLQPGEDHLQIRYRIDGILYDRMNVPRKVQDAIISRIKVMSSIDIAERRLPQDGRASVRIGTSEVDVRISTLPSANGERIVMRLLDKSARLLDLAELGLDPERLKMVLSLLNSAHGIVFVTGPTGSGKTTTLYAGLKTIDAIENNVITIEDPIEYKLPNVSQTEVNTKKGYTFGMGLRHIVRQDPDIIMVGEVRDLETAEIAVQAALTGHLVLSTLHTNDAAGAVTRLLDLGVEPFLVSSSLIGVIAQRLVRKICKYCREPVPANLVTLAEIGVTPDMVLDGKIYRGKGCSECLNTGYHDRVGIYEILPIGDHIREQIMTRVGSATIKADAVKAGLRTLRMDGAHKVVMGESTPEEILRVTQMDVV